MELQTSFTRVDEVLASYSSALGADHAGYRNHVYRVLNYFRALHGAAVPEAVLVAAPFHDIGIWSARCFDYLEPSAREAAAYLQSVGLEHLAPEVRALIHEHHKIRRYTGPFAATVETYRQADHVDVSLGLLRFGLPAACIRSVKAAFPDAGFHWRLATLTARQLLRTPLRPLPMLHW